MFVSYQATVAASCFWYRYKPASPLRGSGQKMMCFTAHLKVRPIKTPSIRRI
jgi:hypothetical protein